MKAKSFPSCRKITIEHDGGTEVYVVNGTARVDTFANGVLEIRTFLAAREEGGKKG